MRFYDVPFDGEEIVFRTQFELEQETDSIRIIPSQYLKRSQGWNGLANMVRCNIRLECGILKAETVDYFTVDRLEELYRGLCESQGPNSSSIEFVGMESMVFLRIEDSEEKPGFTKVEGVMPMEEYIESLRNGEPDWYKLYGLSAAQFQLWVSLDCVKAARKSLERLFDQLKELCEGDPNERS